MSPAVARRTDHCKVTNGQRDESGLQLCGLHFENNYPRTPNYCGYVQALTLRSTPYSTKDSRFVRLAHRCVLELRRVTLSSLGRNIEADHPAAILGSSRIAKGRGVMQNLLPLEDSALETTTLSVVYARFLRSEAFSLELFDGFTSIRVLTYSASIGMMVKLLHRFETVECVFGYEGVLQDFSDILACQKVLAEHVFTAIKGLADRRKDFILDKVHQGSARFFVVRDAVAHAKIYLLEGDGRTRVIVGSANLSDRAFSGKQAETVLVFDDDAAAWAHYGREYETVRQGAASELPLDGLMQAEPTLEDTPILQEARQTRDKLTVFVNTDVATATVPTVIRSVERLATRYRPLLQPLVKPKQGRFQITREVVGKTVQLVRSQKRDEHVQEATWFSIQRDTRKVLLAGKEMPLDADPQHVRTDIACLVEYFENFQNGFHGDIAQHQKDYFLFMSWLYFSPFICDLRNYAIVGQEYIFDIPLFAVLYGKSNCGKTRLIETLMKSMFGYWQFVDKNQFTRTNLRDLRLNTRRFPVVFDDVEKKRFTDHATDIVKDETFMLEEYPAFVLSMNAEDHSFSTEIRKRCLILYTKASLPDNTEAAKTLYKSVKSIQRRISTALYRTYLARALDRLALEPMPADILRLSSDVLTELFAEYHPGPLPAWCAPVSMQDYQGRKYEKIQTELLKLYETNRAIWDVRRTEVILKVQQVEAFGLRKEIPDWLLKEGSKAGNIVLDRKPLESFLGRSLRPSWRRLFRR